MQSYKSRRPPEPPRTNSTDELVRWAREHHQWAIQDSQDVERAAVASNDRVSIRYLTAVPDRLQDGDIVAADGTLWNPGAGKGTYRVSISGTTITYDKLG